MGYTYVLDFMLYNYLKKKKKTISFRNRLFC